MMMNSSIHVYWLESYRVEDWKFWWRSKEKEKKKKKREYFRLGLLFDHLRSRNVREEEEEEERDRTRDRFREQLWWQLHLQLSNGHMRPVRFMCVFSLQSHIHLFQIVKKRKKRRLSEECSFSCCCWFCRRSWRKIRTTPSSTSTKNYRRIRFSSHRSPQPLVYNGYHRPIPIRRTFNWRPTIRCTQPINGSIAKNSARKIYATAHRVS